MTRWRFLAAALLALAFAGNSAQTGRTQHQYNPGAPLPPASIPAADDSCTIYSLTDLGYDADLGKWIAETIPEIMEPDSWGGLRGAIRYYAPKNILIVKQTNAIQKKVDGFLKDLKTSMPKASITSFASKKTPSAGVVAADYREPAVLRTSTPASESSSYPVPAAVKPPKHLFHFIIRYEGDGIIDDNVVKFMKAQLQGAKSPVSVVPSAGAAYIPCAPPPVPPAGSGAPGVIPPSPGYAAPAVSVPHGYPAPTMTSEQPSPAPKKKKGKQNEDKEKPAKTTVTRP